jgi:hypothetical protein
VTQLNEKKRQQVRGRGGNGLGLSHQLAAGSLNGSRDAVFDDASSLDDSAANSYDPHANLLERSALFAGSDSGECNRKLVYYRCDLSVFLLSRNSRCSHAPTVQLPKS